MPVVTGPRHGLIPFDEALALGLDALLLGACDWGHCDGEAWGLRWDPERREYLTVCEPCSVRTRRRKVAATVCSYDGRTAH